MSKQLKTLTCFDTCVSFSEPLTPAEDGAVVRQLPEAFQRGAVPSLVAKLVLALVDGHLDALQGGCRHVGTTHTHPHLTFAEAYQSQAHRVRG